MAVLPIVPGARDILSPKYHHSIGTKSLEKYKDQEKAKQLRFEKKHMGGIKPEEEEWLKNYERQMRSSSK